MGCREIKLKEFLCKKFSKMVDKPKGYPKEFLRQKTCQWLRKHKDSPKEKSADKTERRQGCQKDISYERAP